MGTVRIQQHAKLKFELLSLNHKSRPFARAAFLQISVMMGRIMGLRFVVLYR
jgi:hypothetical protein